MGGNGALTLGLTRPDVFSAIGCFSAGNINRGPGRVMGARASGKPSREQAVFGVNSRSELVGNIEYDCFTKAEAAIKAGKPIPRIFHCVGEQDGGVENARLTAEWFKAHPQIDYLYQEGPGAHTWEFWDEWVQKFLTWLLPANQAAK
jgi:putative tributyrin esterase